jgi:hypothetical protein
VTRALLALLLLLGSAALAAAQPARPPPQSPTAINTYCWNGTAVAMCGSAGTIGVPTGVAGTPNSAVVSVQGISGGTAQPVSGTVGVGSPPVAPPVSIAGVDGSGNKQHLLLDTAGKAQVAVTALPSTPAGANAIGTVGVTALPTIPAGSNAIGTVGVTSLPAIPAGTNAIGVVTTNPGGRTIVTLAVKTVTTGGTAVTAVTAGNRTAGGFIQNPGAPNAVNLCVNEIGTATGITTAGDTICISPGQSYALTPSAGAVSVISSDSSHAFGGYGLQ